LRRSGAAGFFLPLSGKSLCFMHFMLCCSTDCVVAVMK
jgi:hypothetical protein